MGKQVSVLFARSDSNYKKMLGCDVWDKDRDARNYIGANPVICHPPCRGWGRLRKFANPEPGELELAGFAVDQVRRCGGVLEHPAFSNLWEAAGLPGPGKGRDIFGGWTLPIAQFWWGHRANKATWLYIVGCEMGEIPDIPIVLGEASHVISRSRGRQKRPEVTKAEREHTPPELCRWLFDLAVRCGGDNG